MTLRLDSMFTSQAPAVFLTVIGGISSLIGAQAGDGGLSANPFSVDNLQAGGFVAVMSALVWAFMNNRVVTARALVEYKQVVDTSAEKERAHCDAQIADLKEQIQDLRVQRNDMLTLIQPFVSTKE